MPKVCQPQVTSLYCKCTSQGICNICQFSILCLHMWPNLWTICVEFLDQQLIPYRYSSCVCSSCWSDVFKSSLSKVVKSDWDEVWQDCSSCKCASTDGVRFVIWRHTFKWRPWRCFMSVCHSLLHPLTEHVWRQFLIHSTFVFVISKYQNLVILSDKNCRNFFIYKSKACPVVASSALLLLIIS